PLGVSRDRAARAARVPVVVLEREGRGGARPLQRGLAARGPLDADPLRTGREDDGHPQGHRARRERGRTPDGRGVLRVDAAGLGRDPRPAWRVPCTLPLKNEEGRMDRFKAVTFVLLRVVAGFLFVHHGGQKLFAWFGGIPPNGAAAPVLSQAWIGGFLEFFGGLLILIALFTRPVAFILAGEMAVAYFQFHQPGGLLPIQNHGEGAVLYCFIFLLFAAWGAGEWSVDAALARRRAVPVP